MRRCLLVLLGLSGIGGFAGAQTLHPAPGATDVNPDVQLKLTFDAPPRAGATGTIRIRDLADGRIVDTLDMSIPAGPTQPVDPAVRAKNYLSFPYPYARAARPTNANTRPGTPSAGAAPTSQEFQLTIIGGFTDGFHFYPITVDGNTATIHPHHDLLRYGHAYGIEIDAPAIELPGGTFSGITGKRWTFSTKPAARAPRANATRVVVSNEGKGDFDTVQGALDFVPDHSKRRVTIEVRNGLYEEIVYARNKDNVTLRGESRVGTIVRYANNEVFNPHPANIRTNPEAGTFPSRRAAVAIDNCNDVHIVDMTMQTTSPGQAEGLLITGDRNILSRVTVIGAGDALQANGRIYITDSTIVGTGDTILGRGTVFCERCTLKSTGVMMWPRNHQGVHGNVFLDSKFIGTDGPTTIARSPQNERFSYPFAEVVLLNSRLTNIAPEGWSDADKGGNVHFWEFNSRDAAGAPIDVSQRAAWSRQLDAKKDAQVIADFSRPEFVLAGWKPELEAMPFDYMNELRRAEADAAAAMKRDDKAARRGAFSMLATQQAFVGDADRAEQTFVIGGYKRHGANLPDAEAAQFILDHEVRDALAAILELTRDKQVVMINEAHHVPRDRAFSMRVALELRKRGFEYLAMETLNVNTAKLVGRGYPIENDGYYSQDPVFGDYIRRALAVGYEPISYEAFDAPDSADPVTQVSSREELQAQNLVDRVLRQNPTARILVHVGYGHLRKSGETPALMAERFKQKTGIDPFCIDQTKLIPANDNVAAALYAKAAGEAFVLRSRTAANPYSASTAVDLVVYHRPAKLVDGRPDWLAMDGYRRPRAIPTKLLPTSGRRLIQAFVEGERADAVPVDQVLVTAGEKPPVLMLPKGRYRFAYQD